MAMVDNQRCCPRSPLALPCFVADYRKLKVFEKAHALMVRVHQVAKGIRHSYDKGLQSQINRAAQSIPTNIVEGRRQRTDKQFARFLWIALNSATELEYHLTAARDIEAISSEDAEALERATVEVRRMIYGLLRALGENGHA
jgi:four helix bundle protein